MWYKVAQKYNMFGLPLTSKPKVKQFAEEVDENGDDIENIKLPIEENPIEDIIPEDEITPEENSLTRESCRWGWCYHRSIHFSNIR